MSARRDIKFGYDAARGCLHAAGRTIHLPRSRWLRITLGICLILGGILGFLPILGFWMIPLGLLVLSQDLPTVRRWRRSMAIKIGRRNQNRSADRRERENDR